MKSYVEYCKWFLKSNLKEFKGKRTSLYYFPLIILKEPWSKKALINDKEKILSTLNSWREDVIAYCNNLKLHENICVSPEKIHILMVSYGSRQIWNRVAKNLEINKDAHYTIDNDIIKGISTEIDLVSYIDLGNED